MSDELKAAVARAEKAEKELASMKKQNEKFEQVYGLTREELVGKLKQIRELVQKDMQTMKDQEAEIKRQKDMMQHIRTQLQEVKKELLVSGARLTPQQFRDALTTYLKDIRAQIVAGMICEYAYYSVGNIHKFLTLFLIALNRATSKEMNEMQQRFQSNPIQFI